MASGMKNMFSALRDSKTRTILIITVVILFSFVLYAIFLLGDKNTGPDSQARLVSPPRISSVPGGADSSDAYAKLLEEQNRQKAEQALRAGSSTLPTIVRTQKFAEGEGQSAVAFGTAGLGFSTLSQTSQNSGAAKSLFLEQLKQQDCSPEAVEQALARGLKLEDLKPLCTAEQLRLAGFSAQELRDAGFSAQELRDAGFSARELRDAGFSAQELRDAGFSAQELRDAGFSTSQLRQAGFSLAELKAAGFSTDELQQQNCSLEAIKRLLEQGSSLQDLKEVCSARDLNRAGFSLLDLKEAGYSAEELRAAGFSAQELSDAGFSAAQLRWAGFPLRELRAVGYSAEELRDAGFSAQQLREAGFNAAQLRQAGFPLSALSAAGFGVDELKSAGFSQAELQLAGLVASSNSPMISEVDQRDADLQKILEQQAQQITQQELEQRVQLVASQMRQKMTQAQGNWNIPEHVYVEGTLAQQEAALAEANIAAGNSGNAAPSGEDELAIDGFSVKAGDIMFAVLNTAVNSDEPGPILATIVAGPLKGAKLIGSLSLPQNAEALILSFNRMSLPNALKTTSINSVAIDQETARTALSSYTDHHYLLRYGSLFGASFLQGVGDAIGKSGTIITRNNSGSNEIFPKRSIAETALTGLGQVGQSWGNAVRPNFNRPPTVYVYSGTGMGILFTDDVTIPKEHLSEKKQTIDKVGGIYDR